MFRMPYAVVHQIIFISYRLQEQPQLTYLSAIGMCELCFVTILLGKFEIS